MDQNRFSDAWDEIQRPQIHHHQGRDGLANLDGNFKALRYKLWVVVRLVIFFLHNFGVFLVFADELLNADSF